MAALNETYDHTEFRVVSMDATATASTFTGPFGATKFHVKLNTAAASVQLQAGDKSGTDISTGAGKGTTLDSGVWCTCPADRVNAPAEASNRPVVSLQSDTASTEIEVRWTIGGDE